MRLAQLYLGHNRPFDGAREVRVSPNWLVDRVRGYVEIKNQVESDFRLPTHPEEGDYFFSDEQVKVVAFRHGDKTFYASLGWHGGKLRAITKMARIHYTTPTVDRIANVRIQVDYRSNGNFKEMPDLVGIAHQPRHNPDSYMLPWGKTKAERAIAGMKLPVAEGPDGPLHSGDPRRADATFYKFQYGDYLIGMNTTREPHGETFSLEIPEHTEPAFNLASGNRISSLDSINVPPASSVVIVLDR